IVNDMCVTGPYTINSNYGVDGPRQIIPGLQVMDMDGSGTAVQLAVPYGPLYDALVQIADTYQVGMQMYLESSSPAGYFLGFKTYKGKDRTSGQSANARVRFTPFEDTLTNLKELRSISGYKNVAYAFAPSNPVAGVT